MGDAQVWLWTGHIPICVSGSTGFSCSFRRPGVSPFRNRVHLLAFDLLSDSRRISFHGYWQFGGETGFATTTRDSHIWSRLGNGMGHTSRSWSAKPLISADGWLVHVGLEFFFLRVSLATAPLPLFFLIANSSTPFRHHSPRRTIYRTLSPLLDSYPDMFHIRVFLAGAFICCQATSRIPLVPHLTACLVVSLSSLSGFNRQRGEALRDGKGVPVVLTGSGPGCKSSRRVFCSPAYGWTATPGRAMEKGSGHFKSTRLIMLSFCFSLPCQ